MTRTLCLALALTGIAAAASLPVRAADDKKILTGTWTVVKAEEDGKSQPEVLKAKFTFKEGDKILITLADETKPHELSYKLDSTKKPPTIDITNNERKTPETALGIFELDGDKLKLCASEPELKERPTEFKSTRRKVTYLELTRDK